jgi:hypothetical protein
MPHNSDVEADVALATLGTTQLNTSRYAGNRCTLPGLESRSLRPGRFAVDTLQVWATFQTSLSVGKDGQPPCPLLPSTRTLETQLPFGPTTRTPA